MQPVKTQSFTDWSEPSLSDWSTDISLAIQRAENEGADEHMNQSPQGAHALRPIFLRFASLVY